MKAVFGVIIFIVGILLILFGGIIGLAWGVWDIIQNWEVLTFGRFLFDVFLIFIREVIAWGLGIVFILWGMAMVGWRK